MKYYTRTGDKGETGLNGKRVSKDDPEIAAIGDLDELNSAIGVAISFQNDKKVINILNTIQDNLFTIGAELSSNTKKISEKHIEFLENAIDSLNIGEIKKFVLPRGSKEVSLLHYARALTRRAERSITTLSRQKNLNSELLKYINRLSSLLFVLAIYTSKNKLEHPKYL